MILVATALAAPGSTMAGPAAAQDCLYVLNQLGGSITVIRRSSNSVLTTIPNTECAGAAHCSPTALELTASTTSGYVTRQDASVVYVIDPLARRVVGTVPYPAQSSPAAAALSPDGAKLYVANLAMDSVAVIDTASMAVVDSIDVGGQPRAVAVSPDGTTVLVGNNRDDSVTLIRASDDAVLDTVTVGGHPAGIAISADSARAFITNGNSASVSVLTIATRAVSAPIPVGQSPRGIALAGTLAFVTNVLDGTVSVIDTTAGAVVGNAITVGTGPVAVLTATDGATAYVANLSSNTVSVVDTATRAVSTIANIGTPFDLAFGACPQVAACTGDCNGDGAVLINELILGVNIALESRSIDACPAFDNDGSGTVTIAELVRAVGFALNACPS